MSSKQTDRWSPCGDVSKLILLYFGGMNIQLPVIWGSLGYQGFDSYPCHELSICITGCPPILAKKTSFSSLQIYLKILANIKKRLLIPFGGFLKMGDPQNHGFQY